MTTWRRPDCGVTTVFHVDKIGGKYYLKCFSPTQCSFNKEIKFVEN